MDLPVITALDKLVDFLLVIVELFCTWCYVSGATSENR